MSAYQAWRDGQRWARIGMALAGAGVVAAVGVAFSIWRTL